MPQVYYGRKGEPGFKLELSPDLIAVRTRSGQPVTRSSGPVASRQSAQLRDCTLVLDFPEAGVEVYRVPRTRGGPTLEARKAALRSAPDVRFAGGVMVDPKTGSPVLYSENLFVKFNDDADTDACRAVLRDLGLAIKSEPSYAVNAFFVAAPEGTGREVFAIAERLLQRPDVEYAHPELIRERQAKAIFAPQWHLQATTLAGVAIDAHAHVAAAHALTRGEGTTIAVIDDGVDIEHPEFAAPGKVVAPRDVMRASAAPRPQRAGDNHGTACAGVACASGLHGASGVAPAARLLPIRHVAALGSMAEAEAFRWAADNGADVISCSWGPPDGLWWEGDDPLHNEVVQMPPSTRLAIDYAASAGRGGKGCVVLFAAGNGNESVDNDGYACHPAVLAIAACNDRGRRSVYSDFGRALWCAFPSGDSEWPEQGHPAPLTPGIWTTDRRGNAGYNRGRIAAGDAEGLYANDFSGTSSACPGAAGVAALVLAINPALKREEVKDILKRACDRIDPAGGAYDASGFSTRYGWGRLNARRAVELAQPQPRNEITVSRRFDALLPDLQSVSFALEVPESTPVEAVSVAVELTHSYIGDLVLTLQPPPATRAAPIVLHNRSGGTRNRIKKIYDSANTPKLKALAGHSCHGRWTLVVKDAAAEDTGTLVSFSLRLVLRHAQRAVAVPAKKVGAKAASNGAAVKKKAKPAAAKRAAPASPPAARKSARRAAAAATP
jgi:subtilisin family serine protease